MNFNKQLKDGLIYQNPVLVQVLGMCSTMAITTSVANGFGMGISVLIILTLSNIFISLLRKIIPNEVRIACYIVVIAGFVTIVDLCLQAFFPDIAKSLVAGMDAHIAKPVMPAKLYEEVALARK